MSLYVYGAKLGITCAIFLHIYVKSLLKKRMCLHRHIRSQNLFLKKLLLFFLTAYKVSNGSCDVDCCKSTDNHTEHHCEDEAAE